MTRRSAGRYALLALGFLIAPISVGLVFALLEVVSGGYLAWWYLKMSALLGYPPAIIFGLPIYLFVLAKRERRDVSAYLLSGAGIGLAAFVMPFIEADISSGSADGLAYALDSLGGFALLSMLFGAISALVFWLIAIRFAPQ